MRSQAPSTKGFNYGDDQFCKFCGDYIGDFACYNCSNLDPAIIWGENIPCIYCGEYMARCRCEGDHVCIDCNSNPCICDKYTCCPDCGDRWCNGECRHPEPPEPPASTTYTVSLIASGNGSVIGDGEYEVETTADISALCDTNIIFGGWSENSLLVSTSTQYSFNVNSNRCLTGNFHLRDSDCGRLTLKYKTNHLLKAAIMMLNNQKAGNNKEYAYLIASDNMIENFIGEQGKVSFNFNKSSAYRFIVHNHPETPIPSAEDIIAIYKVYCAGKFTQGSGIIMQTNTGTMSIEVDDFDKFELFVLNCFENEEDTDTFRRLFYEPILGEPTDAELKNREIIDKAINFYCNDKGLKVAYPASDGNSTDWYYADSKENSLVFNNCIN